MRSARNRPITSPACVLTSSPTITRAPPRPPAVAAFTAAEVTLWSVMQTTSIRSAAARSASWSSVVTASPDAAVCRWQSTRTQPARIPATGPTTLSSGLQGLEGPAGAILDARTENVGVGRLSSHRVGRVADENALKDAGQLPVREGHVEVQVGKVAPRSGCVSVSNLGPARKPWQAGGCRLGHGGHRGRWSSPPGILGPVGNERADVCQRVGQELVHLVNQRDRPVHPDLLGLLLGLTELTVPAAKLPLKVTVAAGEVA